MYNYNNAMNLLCAVHFDGDIIMQWILWFKFVRAEDGRKLTLCKQRTVESSVGSEFQKVSFDCAKSTFQSKCPLLLCNSIELTFFLLNLSNSFVLLSYRRFDC